MMLSNFQEVKILRFKSRGNVEFSVTLCMNGFHSQSLIKEKYPNITQADIRFLYSSALKRVKIDLKKELYNLTYDEFLKNTALPFALLGCKYENQ